MAVKKRLPSLAWVVCIPFLPGMVFPVEIEPGTARQWQAPWIWTAEDGPKNTWVCFRKSIELAKVPACVKAAIAVDSKYWLWINGRLVVFEGGLKRGPTPVDTYYDEVEIAPHLKKGQNFIAILVWFWGKDGFSHKNSGKGGLLFEADIGETKVHSDQSWRLTMHPAYQQTGCFDYPKPNYRLPESNVTYDARDDILSGWTEIGYDDSAWGRAVAKGVPPVAPWNNLWKRPIPQWKYTGLIAYVNEAQFPTQGTGKIIRARLPYNAQVTPYLKIEAPAGLKIDIRTDDYTGGGWYAGGLYTEPSVRATYITRAGIQEFESYGWMNGHEVFYRIPKGVKILALKYRESGYDTEFVGAFACSDPFYNVLWEKSRRTLYVNMRDSFMDCPERERAQWWGDVVIDIGQTFSAFDQSAHALIRKAISNLVNWQRKDDTLFSPIPAGNWDKELPVQMLASISPFGFWTYYLHTGDPEPLQEAFPHVKRYLSLWTLDTDGLVMHRKGGWDLGDWGKNIDMRLLDNCWYYLALQSALNMAELKGEIGDVASWKSRMQSIADNFNRVFWNGKAYRSPGYRGKTDDRGNALAVLTGLADSAKWPLVREVLRTQRHASPGMEKYMLEALYRMHADQDALDRMKARYREMVNDQTCTTLWELWEKGGPGTYNHAWAGGPLTLLSQYTAGVAPDTPGFAAYHVLPQEGGLDCVDVVVPSVKGNIHVMLKKDAVQYALSLSSPPDTRATVGMPKACLPGKAVRQITANGVVVWEESMHAGGANNVVFQGQDQWYYLFSVPPGDWEIVAR